VGASRAENAIMTEYTRESGHLRSMYSLVRGYTHKPPRCNRYTSKVIQEDGREIKSLRSDSGLTFQQGRKREEKERELTRMCGGEMQRQCVCTRISTECGCSLQLNSVSCGLGTIILFICLDTTF
jgi:hypothetical protein